MSGNKRSYFQRNYLRIKAFTRNLVLPGFDNVPLYKVSTFFIKGLQNGAITTRASSIAFNFFLALIPATIFIFSILPYIPIKNFTETLLEIIRDILPGNVSHTSTFIIEDIKQHQKGGIITLGFLLSIFFATNGVAGIITSFNKTYHVHETRKPLKIRLVSLLLVFLLSVIAIFSITFIIMGKNAFMYLLENQYLQSNVTMNIIRFSRWIIVALMFFFIISFIYFYAPAKRGRYRFMSAGSTLATILSLIVSIIFKYWFNHFVKFNILFGSIGSLMVILLWLYFISIILLIGFELNASIRNANKS